MDRYYAFIIDFSLPKVADCICLSGLDKVEVVPVDVHIARAAALRGIEVKSLSNAGGYSSVSQRLSQLWTPYAGWAQVVSGSINITKDNALRKCVVSRNRDGVQEFFSRCLSRGKKCNKR